MSTPYNPLAGLDPLAPSIGQNSILPESAPGSELGATILPSSSPVTALSPSLPGNALPASFSSTGGVAGSNNPLTSALDELEGAGLGGSALGASIPGSGSGPGLSVSRVVAVVLGLLLIGGGILMFRPVQEAARTAGKAAAAAAA